MAKTKFITVPLKLFQLMKPSNATVLAYINYRLKFNVTFIESNEQIAKVMGMSETGIAQITRKLKLEGYINYVCKRHNSIVIGSKLDIANQKTIRKAYCRNLWLTKTGEKLFN